MREKSFSWRPKGKTTKEKKKAVGSYLLNRKISEGRNLLGAGGKKKANKARGKKREKRYRVFVEGVRLEVLCRRGRKNVYPPCGIRKYFGKESLDFAARPSRKRGVHADAAREGSGGEEKRRRWKKLSTFPERLDDQKLRGRGGNPCSKRFVINGKGPLARGAGNPATRSKKKASWLEGEVPGLTGKGKQRVRGKGEEGGSARTRGECPLFILEEKRKRPSRQRREKTRRRKERKKGREEKLSRCGRLSEKEPVEKVGSGREKRVLAFFRKKSDDV